MFHRRQMPQIDDHRVPLFLGGDSAGWGLIVGPRGWLSVIRGNPANAAEGLGGVQPGDPIWLTAPRAGLRRAHADTPR